MVFKEHVGKLWEIFPPSEWNQWNQWNYIAIYAAAWLEDGYRVCDQCPGEDEHVQNEVHAL